MNINEQQRLLEYELFSVLGTKLSGFLPQDVDVPRAALTQSVTTESISYRDIATSLFGRFSQACVVGKDGSIPSSLSRPPLCLLRYRICLAHLRGSS